MEGADEGMQSLYQDDSGSKPKTIDQEEQEEMAETATIPLKVLTHGDQDQETPQEGDKCMIEIVKINGDQALIKYAEEQPKGMGEEGEGNEMSSDDELDQLGKQY